MDKEDERKGSIVLIPLLSKMEDNNEFLEQATRNASEVVVLLVIDTNAMTQKFGFAASEISHGNALLEKVAKALAGKGVRVNDILEWGDTPTTIAHIAKLRDAERVAMVAQDNHYFLELVKKLEGEKLKIEVITPSA